MKQISPLVNEEERFRCFFKLAMEWHSTVQMEADSKNYIPNELIC